jgi:predicted aconitase with swiveling domain
VPGDPNNTQYPAGVALSAPPSVIAFAAGVDAGDLVTLLVEVQPIDGPFLNTPNVDGGSVPSDGNPALATIPALGAGMYHWQVQGLTLGGSITDWVQYNDGGLAFTICDTGTCPDPTATSCVPTDVTSDPLNCWACGNSCNNGWCDPNFPDGGQPGSGGVYGCHTPATVKGGLSAPIASAVNGISLCYYYAQSTGLNSQSNSVPLSAADWFPLTPQQTVAGIAADPNGVAVAINAPPNDAGLNTEVLYFPNDGGCGSGLSVLLDTESAPTYHGIASDGTNVYLTVTAVVDPDAGTTDDEVWKIPIATAMTQVLTRNQKGLSDIIYNPVAGKLFFLSRGSGAAPNAIFSMGTDGSAPMAIVPAAPEAFGPTPALAYSPTTGQPAGTLYWTSGTGVYSSAGGSTKIINGLTTPTGVTTFLEGPNHTDAVFVTTSDGKLIEWHRSDGSQDTLATNQQHPSYPLPYASSCAASPCSFDMTWVSEQAVGHGGWYSIDFPN